MRTVLFVSEDNSLLSRIKIMFRDSTIQYFYADNGDAAAQIVEQNEIMAVMVSLSMSVMNGAELIELFLEKNPKLQMILLFEEKDTALAAQIHNQYHMCKVRCKNLFVLEDLQKDVEDALFSYNKEDEIKKIEDEFRDKEDKYKKTMLEISELLNDRMESYQEVVRLFSIYEKFTLHSSGNCAAWNDSMIDYKEQVLSAFIQIHLLRELNQEDFFQNLQEEFHNSDIKKYYKIVMETQALLPREVFLNAAFLLSILSRYFYQFYSEYRGKIVITENTEFYLLNVLYDVKLAEDLKEMGEYLFELNKKLISAYAEKAAYGRKEHIMQYKIYFTKPKQKEV